MAKKGSTTQAFAQLALKLTTGDKEDIRGMKMADGRHMFSVYDIMWNTGAYNTYDAAKKAWSRLLQSDFGEEVGTLSHYLKFPSQGQRDTPCMDLVGIQRLFAILNGKIGEEYRKLAVASLTRILAGDLSLVREIQSNASSTASIHELARAAVGSKRVREPGPSSESQMLQLQSSGAEPVGPGSESPMLQLQQVSREAARLRQETMDQMMEVSNAFGSRLAQQKTDSAEAYEIYVKIAKLQSDIDTNKHMAEINQKEKLFQMDLEQKRIQDKEDTEQKEKLFQQELEQNEKKAEQKRIQDKEDAEQKEKELAYLEKVGEQKRIQAEKDAKQKRLHNEEELCFLQRKQELIMAVQEPLRSIGPKKMVQTKLDFFGKNKSDMKTYSELFVEVAKGTAPPETFGPTAKHVAELYEQTFKTQPVKLGRHHMYHKDHFDIIKKWTLEFELLLQFLQQKASC